uniref:Uncharacterized protein n=1 Tax=Rhodnius prolixus TaxID=13249 RepID=T1ID33_RHOPR
MFGMKYTVLVSLALILFSACLGISTALVQTVSSSPNSGYSFLSTVTGRNSKRGGVLKKIALPLLLLFGLKTGIAVPLVFGTVALAAFKGLWSGLTALVVTAALALRGLLPPPRIVQLPPPPPPHHAHITDYYTDYRRADDLSRVDDYRYGWK